jgi:3',5'-cyclic AMP phosphodiesterase CpdA
MFAMVDAVRLGHISDLHLRCHLSGTAAVSARRSRDMPALFTEALASMEGAGVDVVVVTGDLVDHPDNRQTPETLHHGEADLRLVAEALARLSCPWVVLPGNHDHPQLFGDVFGRPAELDVRGVRVIAFFDWDRPVGTVEEEDERPNVPRRVGEERARFEAALAAGDRRPQIHLQHYVITPRLDEGWPHTYWDGESIRDSLVGDPRVRLALSGHYHLGVDSFLEGDASTGTWFSVAPAFCEAPHPYLLHELGQDSSMATTRLDLRPQQEMSL